MPTLRLPGASPVTSSSSMRTRPLVGVTKPAIIRSVVVLPHPDGPRRVRNSPSRTSRLSPSTAAMSPKRRVTSTRVTRAMTPASARRSPSHEAVPLVAPLVGVDLGPVHHVGLVQLLVGEEQDGGLGVLG